MLNLRRAIKIATQLGIQPLFFYGLYRLGILSGHYRRLDSAMRADAGRGGAFRPIFSLPDRAALLRDLTPTTRGRIQREAEAAAKGRVRLFGDRFDRLALASGRRLPHWTAYERNAALLTAFAFPHGDIKYLWEPARFGWAFALARMFHLTGDERYARAFWLYFGHFEKGNPPYTGPQWMNGQEVAIRLMALLWAAHAFLPARASTSTRLSRLWRSIALHAARIPPTLVYARAQNNNHILTEAAALFLAGTALDRRPWRELGWKLLNRALQTQIGTYGEYIQHSTNYHRVMLHTVLLVEAACRKSGLLWPARTQGAIARASHWLFSMIDPVSGRTPNLGANDGALILPLSACAFDDFRPTVQAAARAFLRTSLPPGEWDDLSVWLDVPAGHHTAGSSAYAAEHPRNRDSWAYVRASAWKSRLSHMDQLHLDLWWRGLNVVADAGTYLYNGAPPWDNPLVSSQVHNCVTVDGRDQMTRAGRFLVLDWFPAYSQEVLAPPPSVQRQIRASHRGYAPLGLLHERTLSLMESGMWQVQDDLVLIRRGRHMLRLQWLILDGAWKLTQTGNTAHLLVRLPGGRLAVDIACNGALDGPPEVALVRAGRLLYGKGPVHPWQGWISPTYGRKVPALSLTVEARVFADCRLTTEFHLPTRQLAARSG